MKPPWWPDPSSASVAEDETVELGSFSPVVFLRLEHDESGIPYASFATADGDSFCLDAAALELRLRVLAQQGRDTSEERKAQQQLRRWAL